MNDCIARTDAGFAFLPGGRTFSQGVVTLPGYHLRRYRLLQPRSLEEGCTLAAQEIRTIGLSLAALAGFELRIPRQLPGPEFRAFNERYLTALAAAGFAIPKEPAAARTNMAPLHDLPEDATIFAFTVALPSASPRSWRGTDFLLSGMPERATDPERVIAPGDSTHEGMMRKAAYVLTELKLRAQTLGADWSEATAAQVYMRPAMEQLLPLFSNFGLPPRVLTHVPGDPPLMGPDGIPYQFEMDVRSVTEEAEL